MRTTTTAFYLGRLMMCACVRACVRVWSRVHREKKDRKRWARTGQKKGFCKFVHRAEFCTVLNTMLL